MSAGSVLLRHRAAHGDRRTAGRRRDGVRGFAARFAGVVFPGETIRLRAWDEGERIVVDAAIGGEGERAGSPVLSECVLTRV
ncbi:MAG: hypothetical protein ACR2FG_06670 [Marmoricola sp.]